MMKIDKEIGMIKEVVDYTISFDNFCELDTVSYMRRQLKETKFKNKEAKTKHSAGGTRKSYSITLWHFNNWLHGKTITISVEIKHNPSTADGILSFAENNKTDLIVMGSHGRSGFKKLVLGSVASEVVTKSSCRVLIIKPPKKDS